MQFSSSRRQLRAFERFLHDYPDWVGKVALIQVTSPSPGDSPALATKVSELVDQINGSYGSLEFQPVHHYHQTIERDVSFWICRGELRSKLTRLSVVTVSAHLRNTLRFYQWPIWLSSLRSVTV